MNTFIRNQIINDIHEKIGTIIIMLGGNNFPPWIYDYGQHMQTIQYIITNFEKILDAAEVSKYV